MNGLFGINGLLGYFIAVILLLSVVFCLGYAAVVTQKAQANNPYVIENANTLQMTSKSNAEHYKNVEKGE